VKRFYAALLALPIAVAISSAPAGAALRAPQLGFGSPALQNHLDSQGESINVLTDQQDALEWGTTVSGNSTLTIQFDVAGNISGCELGIAKLDATGKIVTGLVPVFPATAGNGCFAVASFRPGDLVVVNLFNPLAQLSDTKSFTGVNKARFAYYIKWNGNTYYSHDGFNSDGMVHALTFAGNGQNTGCWWQCWEESEITDYAQADFDDAVVFMESLNPTPVSHMTWGRVKARFR